MRSTIDLTVIIPLYKTPDFLRCLKSVCQLNVKEIIVVDSSPTPSEINFNELNVIYIHLKERLYAGAARNLGAQKATGRWLFFVDADIELTPATFDFIQSFDFLNTQSLVFGPYEFDRKKQNFSIYLQNLIIYMRFVERALKPKYITIQTSHFIISKETFWAIGGFDENLRFREDHTFCVMAQKMGYQITVDRNFVACHHRPFSSLTLIQDYFKRQYLAEQTRLLWPQLHGGENVPASFIASWLVSCLIPVFLVLLLAQQVSLYAFVVLTVFGFLFPLLVCRTLFRRLQWVDQFRALVLWPSFGWALAAATIFSHLAFFGVRFKKSAIKIIDAAIIAQRLFFRNGWPVALVHFLNSHCNLRCSHCFYKETLDQPVKTNMPIDTLTKLSTDIGPLLWYSVGGGEPFLRKDLVQALSTISRNCRPWILSIPTNGWYADKIFISLRRLIEANPAQRIMLTVSIDGSQKQHDLIRSEGSWKKAHNTFLKLQQLQKIYPQLSLGIITVVDETNADSFPDLIDELVRDFNPQQVAINIYRDSDRFRQTSPRVLRAHAEAIERYQVYCEKKHLQNTGFFAQRLLRARETVKNKAIAQVVGANKFVTPCLGGQLFYTIWEDGRLSPCEMRPEVYGHLMRDSWASSIRSRSAEKSRQDILENKCKCSYECAMSVNALFSWPLAQKTIQKAFASLE